MSVTNKFYDDRVLEMIERLRNENQRIEQVRNRDVYTGEGSPLTDDADNEFVVPSNDVYNRTMMGRVQTSAAPILSTRSDKVRNEKGTTSRRIAVDP
jgi:hypothetical protein